MSLKDIIVHVDDTPSSKARINISAQLASEHDAHLVGLYVIPAGYLQSMYPHELPEAVLDVERKRQQENAEAAEQLFLETTKLNAGTSEWRCEKGSALEAIQQHARYSDLVVVGQSDPERKKSNFEELPENLILSASAPVLVIPNETKFNSIGHRALVAWDGSVQATRAIQQALPLLEKSERVTVFAVNPKQTKNGHGEIPCADMCLHLARHGIKADAQAITANDVDVSELLETRAMREEADLLVMGAYGHSRFRELMLGGVTAHMLNHATRPVLMAH